MESRKGDLNRRIALYMTGINRSKQGFTLIELLISIAMATVMFGALGLVLINVISVQNNTLRKQEVLHNVRIITETMARYMRLATPYRSDNLQHHTSCVKEHSYFGGLDMSSSGNLQGVSAESYIQFLSPIDQSVCMRFYLKEGEVMMGTQEEGDPWEDYPITAQEDVSVVLLEFQQGGTSAKTGHIPAVTVLVHAGIESLSQGSSQKTYDYLMETQVMVTVRNLSTYSRSRPSIDETRGSNIVFMRRTQTNDPHATKYRWLHECTYDITVEVDVDAIKRAYYLRDPSPGVSTIDDSACKVSVRLDINTYALTEQPIEEKEKNDEIVDNNYQVQLWVPLMGKGIQSFNTRSPRLPCEASYFAVRIDENRLESNGSLATRPECTGIKRSSVTFQEQYYTPYILPLPPNLCIWLDNKHCS